MSTAARSILRSEMRLFSREPGSLFWIVAFPAALVAVLGLVPEFREPSEDLGGQRVIDLYVPIAIVLAVAVGAVQAMPTVLATYREQRVLRRISTTPARPRDVLVAQYVVHGAAIVAGAVLAFVVGWAAYGVAIPGNLFAFVAIVALTMAACLALGGLIAGTAPNARVATAVGMTVFFVLVFSSGLWFPVQTMPAGLADVVAMTPLGAAVLALEAATLGGWPAAGDLLVLVVWAVAGSGLAVRWFKWD